MQSAADPKTLAADPAWLPHKMDIAKGAMRFARIDRQGLAREAFLDNRMSGSVAGWADARIDDIAHEADALPAPASQPVFIFHTAFCCSTLMARALDAQGKALALKEPDILMDLANAYRMAKGPDARRTVDNAQRLVMRLLARPHEGSERVLIKPTNTANNLAPVVTKLGARAVFLFGDLKGFLISVLKKGEACKAFVRKQYTIFALDDAGVGGIPERQALGLTDLQIAALVWRHQMELFTRILNAPGADHVRSLDFRVLLDRPVDALTAASEHLQLGVDAQTLKEVANGPVFQKNSKFGDQDYDAGARARDEAALMERYGEELAMIENWAMRLKLANDISPSLPKPLLTA